MINKKVENTIKFARMRSEFESSAKKRYDTIKKNNPEENICLCQVKMGILSDTIKHSVGISGLSVPSVVGVLNDIIFNLHRAGEDARKKRGEELENEKTKKYIG